MVKLALLLFLFPWFHKHPKPEPKQKLPPLYCIYILDAHSFSGMSCNSDPDVLWDMIATQYENLPRMSKI